MKNRRQKLWLVALLIGTAACTQEESSALIGYVALGDSLAAGQTPYAEIDESYADIIAEELNERNELAFYTKELAVPGYTTEDVLQGIRQEEAEGLIATADLVTISAGANDLLRLVQFNPETGSLTFSEDQIETALENIEANINTILSELKNDAPGAEIYVMGYYFPFPHLPAKEQEGLAEQLDRLNETLKYAANQHGLQFVPVDEAFNENETDKLPNPDDIHPSREGYEAMAEAFWGSYGGGTP